MTTSGERSESGLQRDEWRPDDDTERRGDEWGEEWGGRRGRVLDAPLLVLEMEAEITCCGRQGPVRPR